MDRMERSAPILQSNSNSSNSSSNGLSVFSVTPYKICVSALICAFTEDKSLKSNPNQREIGMFCLICMKSIQSLDCSYNQFLSQISQPFVTNKVKKKMIDKLVDISNQGLSQLMELMTNLKQISYIQKSSIVGLFIRRMWLYFDKLSFSAVSQLFDDLMDYMRDRSAISFRNDNKIVNKLETCPQQMQYFISKQLNLIQINEKKAMTPFELLDAIKKNCDTNDIGIASPQNDFNDVHFLKYLNALRVNEFAAAKESLMAYFDGNSNQMSRCWAALNLAILHSHFKHEELAIQAIKECISAAQESNDEKCLEFALMWVSRVLSQKDCDSDVSLLLNHLQSKANELGLPYIASISQLQSEKLRSTSFNSRNSNTCSPSLTSSTPGILAVRHSMNDVLMMSYSSRAALLNLFGASNLAALTSQVLLHLNVVEPVGESNVYHVNENTCIGVRNIALHLWRNVGQYSIARDMLLNLTSLYSQYKSDLNSICCQALAEIDFELNLNLCNWKSAEKCVLIINSCDRIEANIKLAQMKVKQGDKEQAIRLIDNILNSDTIQKRNCNLFIRINALLLKGKILNEITIILECIDLCKQNKLTGLECSCLVQLSLMLQQNGLISQSQQILNTIMIRLLANGTCYDIAKAHYINAGNHFRIWESKMRFNGITDQSDLEIAKKSNQRAIDLWKLIEDKQSLKDSLELQANICHKIQDYSQRNYFARQLRLLKMPEDLT